MNVGDIVELLVDHPEGNVSLMKGDVGKIVYAISLNRFGVDWGKPISGGHECEGRVDCSQEGGWYVNNNVIALTDKKFNENRYEDMLI